MAALFDRMFELRQRAARNAGFANYRDYSFPAKFRFDYTPADCERFHDAVEAQVVPGGGADAGERRRAPRARRPPALGSGRGSLPPEPLRPFTTERVVGKARAVFERVDPVLGTSSRR